MRVVRMLLLLQIKVVVTTRIKEVPLTLPDADGSGNSELQLVDLQRIFDAHASSLP